MASAIARHVAETSMPAAAFRDFQRGRPDSERWELFAGRAVMMTPPTTIHQIIAGNLQRLLQDALEKTNDDRNALQRPGVDLDVSEAEARLGGGDYRPEPDVAIVEAPADASTRFSRHVYLSAEIVSSTDAEMVGDVTKLEAKIELYRAHKDCLAILEISQNKIRSVVHTRNGDVWSSETLIDETDIINLPQFGFSCSLNQIYKRTGIEFDDNPSP